MAGSPGMKREVTIMRSMRRSLVCFVFIAVVFSVGAGAQKESRYGQEIKEFKEFVAGQMEFDRIPGLSVGFYKDDFVWTDGFGYADLENMVPAKSKTEYRLASNTKSMTAVAILQLMERGRLNLDAEVQEYVPYFPRKRWPITIRQVLGHLGGITHYKDYEKELHIKVHKDTRESIDIFDDFDLVAEPGTEYNYSSYGYNLLGAVIESVARESYGDYMKNNLWKVLDMNDTYMDDPERLIPNRAKGYRLVDGVLKNSEFIDISSRFAAGGTRSTVVDLLKYARGLTTEKVLSRKTIDLMETSMYTTDGHLTDYGMGWRIEPVNGRFCVFHTGGQAETRTLLLRLPVDDFAIALAYNFEGANLFHYSRRLFQLIFGEQWNIDIYFKDPIDDAIFDGMRDVYNYGLAYFERHKRAVTRDSCELKKAFNYFNRCVSKDSLKIGFKRFIRKIRDGRHPVAEYSFVKVGSFMASVLDKHHDHGSMKKYHKYGALPFFRDYIRTYMADPDFPVDFCFHDDLEKLIIEWCSQWELVYTDEVCRVAINPVSDLKSTEKILKRAFRNAAVYPDFLSDIFDTGRYFYLSGVNEKASRIADLAKQLYPDSPVHYVLMANISILSGEKERAEKLFKKAKEIDPDSRAVSARGLNGYALDFIEAQRLDEAKELIEIAISLYPDDPGLYHTMGEIYLKKAKKFFEKAMKADPNFEPSRRRLKKIK